MTPTADIEELRAATRHVVSRSTRRHLFITPDVPINPIDDLPLHLWTPHDVEDMNCTVMHDRTPEEKGPLVAGDAHGFLEAGAREHVADEEMDAVDESMSFVPTSITAPCRQPWLDAGCAHGPWVFLRRPPCRRLRCGDEVRP